ncbi:MAG: thiamine-monophosphate kinase [Phycisphaerales bacterium JB059]
MHERDLLSSIQARSEAMLRPFAARVLIGPGDDCALLAHPAGQPIVVGVDQLIVGRHCEPETPIDLIARKAIARSVSDIGAMGATPTWALAAAKLPRGYAHADELFEACARWAAHWGCPLVGGDIATSPSELALSITVAGDPHPTRGPVLRSGARPGDLVAVTGPIGDSFTSGWHLRFEPRVEQATRLCDELGDALHAMIDISDGLGLDADRVARASGVTIEIETESIPARAGSTSTWRERVAHGEDYELLVTLAPQATPPEGLHVIGRVFSADAEGGARFRSPEGERVDAGTMGWDHGEPGDQAPAI